MSAVPEAASAGVILAEPEAAAEALAAFMAAHPRLVVLTGAGCSTESGIPDYRDDAGAWKRRPPVQYRDFMRSEQARRRYWARSMLGFPVMQRAEPNAAHRWLADREADGAIELLVTQNVDGLHGRAGHREVDELHGRIRDVVCTDCRMQLSRALIQERLELLNGALLTELRAAAASARPAPDGDADVDDLPLEGFRVPACDACGGVLKPDVVFFGESVPPARVQRVRDAIDRSDALLVLGSSLMVYSGFRFARHAAAAGRDLVIVNRGATRADDLAALRLAVPCAELFRLLGQPTDPQH